MFWKKKKSVNPDQSAADAGSKKPRRSRLDVESLEKRVLLSASWVDADTGDAQDGPTEGNDAATGTEAADLLAGKGGHDLLSGEGGDDILSGGDGDDTLEGGDGNDVLSGDGVGGEWFDETGHDSFEDMADAYADFADNADFTLTFDELANGEQLGDQYAESHGVTFENTSSSVHNNLTGVQDEGGAYVENLTGYDSSYDADGDNVYLKFANNDPDTPFSVSFEEPVAEVGSMFAVGKEGPVHSVQVTVYDADGAVIGQRVVEPELWDDTESQQNYEGFFHYKSDQATIARVEFLNLSTTNYSNALVIDNLAWSETPTLEAGSGNDVLSGGEGNDALSGGDGNDVLAGNAGNDTLDGGAGIDTADYSTAAGPVTVDITLDGVAQDVGADGTDTLSSIEAVVGSQHDDTFAFAQPTDGATYTVDGNGGTNTIDLSGVSSDDAVVGSGRIVVQTETGSFQIEHANIESVTFSDGSIETPDPDAVDANDPIHRWHFTGSGAVDLAGDSSGTLEGDTAANSDGSASFDGSDHVVLEHTDDMLLDEGTVHLRFNPESVSGTQGLFSKDSTNYDDGGHLTVWVKDGEVEVRLQSDSHSVTLRSDVGLQAGEWHDVSFSFGADGAQLFVDGELADTDSYTGGLGTSSGGTGNTEPIVIGANAWQSGDNDSNNLKDHFTGQIEDVAIFGEQLDAADVEAMTPETPLPSTSDLGLPDTATTQAEIAARGPVAHWSFSESGVTDTVGDADGTYSGNAEVADADGRAVSFDGNGDYVVIEHDAALELNEGSIELRFNTDDANDRQGLFSKDSSGYDDGGHVTMWVDDGRVEVRIQSDDTSYTLQSDAVVSTGEWTDVALHFGEDGLRLFVNGELEDTDPYTGGLGTNSGGTGNTEPIVIGANQWGSGDGVANNIQHHFSGQIADVAIYGPEPEVSPDDVFDLSGSVAGDAHAIDGGEGNDTIDLSTFSSDDVSFGNGVLTVSTDDGGSFTVDYENVETITFADGSATIVDGDLVDAAVSSGDILIDGGVAIQINLGADSDATVKVSHTEGSSGFSIESASDSLTLESLGDSPATLDVTNTNENADIVIRGDAGEIDLVSADFSGTLQINGGAGSIGTNGGVSGDIAVTGDLGTLTVVQDVSGEVTIGGDATSIDLSGHLAGDGEVSVGGHVQTFSIAGDVQTGTAISVGSAGTVTLDDDVIGSFTSEGDVGTLTVTDDVYDGGVVEVSGDVGRLEIGDLVRTGGTVTVGGFAETVSIGNDVQAGTTMAFGQAEIIEVGDDFAGTMTVGSGTVDTIEIGGTVTDAAAITLGGDFNDFTADSFQSGTSIVIENADGVTAFSETGGTHSVTLDEPTRITFDGDSITTPNEAPTDLSLAGGNVAESAVQGTVVGTVSATDPDAGETFSYELTDNAGGRFEVNESGEVVVADGASLDHESAGTHSVTVQVTDSAGHTISESFDIMVGDVNETPTDIWVEAEHMRENTAGEDILIAVVDPDGDSSFVFEVSDDRFEVNDDGGEYTLRLKDGVTLDHEAESSVSVTVTATDDGGASFAKTIDLAVLDVNEAPEAIAFSGGTVAEDAGPGTVVGTASATDPDAGDQISYSLVDDADGRFVIDPATGEVSIADGVELDAESAASHQIEVRATDTDGSFIEQGMTITVSDVNESPESVTVSGGSVAENAAAGTVAASVTVSDPDAGESFSYELIDDADGQFEVNEAGEIVVADGASLDHESSGTHSVTVQVTDSAGHTISETIEIAVGDVNEGPVLSPIEGATLQPGQSMSVPLSAADPDGDSLTYTVSVEGYDTTAYELDQELGLHTNGNLWEDWGGIGEKWVLDSGNTWHFITQDGGFYEWDGSSEATGTLIAELDPKYHEDPSLLYDAEPVEPPVALSVVGDTLTVSAREGFSGTYDIMVKASDGEMEDVQTFSVEIENVGPDAAGDAFVTSEDQPLVTPSVLTNDTDLNGDALTVSDFSQPEHGTVAYNNDGTFTYTPEADYHGSDAFTYTITDDAGGTAAATVEITVESRNDQSSDITFVGGSVSENAPIGTVAATAAAVDVDTEDTHTYSLVDDADGRFAIDPATGEVVVSGELDHESAGSHTITVRATDAEGLAIERDLVIAVGDVNEAPEVGSGVVITAGEGETVSLVAGASDQDGDALTYHWQQVGGPEVSLDDAAASSPSFTAPDLGADASITFEVSVSDGEHTTTETVTVEVEANEAPALDTAETMTVREGSSVTLEVAARPAGQVSFDGLAIESHGGSAQDVALDVTADGDALRMEGNGWKSVEFPYTVTEDTILEFQFRSTAEGEIQGIGFDNDSSLTPGTMFKVLGTQNWGNSSYEGEATDDGEWVTYRIPVGEHFTGDFDRLVFMNDHDVASPTAVSEFRGVQVYEAGDATGMDSDLTYEWRQTGGPAVTLDDPNSTTPTFEAPDVGQDETITFEVSVSDGDNVTTETVEVKVEANPGPKVVAVDDITIDERGEVTLGAVIETPEPETLDFDTADINAHGGTAQDVDLEVVTSGDTLELTGNGWKSIPMDAQIEPDTVLEFQFRSDATGEIHGIGFDTNGSLSPEHTFQLHGTQNWGIQAEHSYEGSEGEWVTYRIPVGEHFTGDFDRIVFVNDHDTADADANSAFRGLRLTNTADDGTPAVDSDITYTWEQISGPTVTLSDPSAANPTFEAPEVGNETEIRFRVTASDGDNLTTDEVAVHVQPVNEAPEAIAFSGGTVAENAPVGTVVATASAIDPDAGDSLMYTLTDDAGGRFSIDAATGEVVVSGDLDHESAGSHTITVRATDAEGLTVERDLTVAVGDVNEGPESVTVSGGSVAENASAGTVAASVTVSDPDAGESFSYALTDNAGGRFEVNESGEVVVADGASLDHESAGTHSVTVQVTDSAGHTISETIEIAVGDVNEGPGSVTVSGGSVAENAAAGTVAASVTVSDPDAGESFSYELIDDADGRFEVNESGEVVVADGASLDHESAGTHSVTVQVTDSAGHTISETIEIAVGDVNEGPVLAEPGVIEAGQGQTVVLASGAVDPDADVLRHEWRQVSGPPVQLDDPTAAAPSFVAPDLEIPQNAVFEVVVSDGENTETTTVTVAIASGSAGRERAADLDPQAETGSDGAATEAGVAPPSQQQAEPAQFDAAGDGGEGGADREPAEIDPTKAVAEGPSGTDAPDGPAERIEWVAREIDEITEIARSIEPSELVAPVELIEANDGSAFAAVFEPDPAQNIGDGEGDTGEAEAMAADTPKGDGFVAKFMALMRAGFGAHQKDDENTRAGRDRFKR